MSVFESWVWKSFEVVYIHRTYVVSINFLIKRKRTGIDEISP